jgi:hypothetical protein
MCEVNLLSANIIKAGVKKNQGFKDLLRDPVIFILNFKCDHLFVEFSRGD